MDFRKFRKEIGVEDGRRMTKRDYCVLIVLLAVYSLVAFLNLGAVSSPHTVWTAETGTSAIIDLGETKRVTEIRFYGSIAEGELAIYDDSQLSRMDTPVAVFRQENGDMYKWKELALDVETRYLVLYVQSGTISMNEIAVFSSGVQLRAAADPDSGAEKLVDEQKAVPLHHSYLDDMYFDEIYHARTAYEIVQNDDLVREAGREAAAWDGYSIYEWTHPSLGKLFIAVGVRIFGMTPFGWRFSGAFFGVLILAVLYVFAKRIFRRTDYALVTAGLFAADCMHYAQTRIATIDTYALFFTLLMFLFMGDYISEDFEKRPYWKKIALLGLSGAMFGLGVSSKWTCLYSGAGLAVLYFGDLICNLVRICRTRRREKKEALGRIAEHKRLLAEAIAANDAETAAELRTNMPKFERKKTPINILAYLPVLFVIGVLILHFSGHWIRIGDYRQLVWNGHEQVMQTDASYGVDTIDTVFLQPWFYRTLLALSGVAIASSVVFRHLMREREDVDLSVNNLLMTPVWCCLFFIAVPIALYVLTNYCYYITDGCRTLSEALGVLWRKQVSMYHYHADLEATHLCQSMWYQWPLAQKSVWFYYGSMMDGEKELISNISSTGNPAVWYVSAFGAVIAAVKWFRDPECRKDRAFIVAFVGILAGLLPWALVTRCVFLYHYFSTIPFVMLMTMLLLFYVEKKYPRTGWLKWAWLFAAAIVFLLMLPAISGIPVSANYAKFIENALAVFGKVYYAGV